KARIDKLVKDGTISGGMLPKVMACLNAILNGVGKTHIVDGRVPHCLLLEIFTKEGVGTEILG
ncbi:MAG: acetylglutamate kinase, partial [Nitrospiraceae bacterium]|nr:acetylglutamate kinase [Nitrospiraceae bacterium]